MCGDVLLQQLHARVVVGDVVGEALEEEVVPAGQIVACPSSVLKVVEAPRAVVQQGDLVGVVLSAELAGKLSFLAVLAAAVLAAEEAVGVVVGELLLVALELRVPLERLVADGTDPGAVVGLLDVPVLPADGFLTAHE
jgi:hypothetical protein